ncbi:MAG: hypothetical protein HQ583_05395, partial [Candidatus Abyssubacteria bacterium]|nr:hypothetical protein [Candidatus Abyssubacteria bacterium]
VLCVVGVLLFMESYQRWGHPIIDLGRDLYLPSQILQGRVLYQELLYNYGPTVPYMLAGITAVFGDSLWVFVAVGLAIGVLTATALYAIGARLGGCATGFGSALMFLIYSFFANSTWGCNFVLPYSYSATLGAALGLWSFYFLYCYLYGERSPRSLAWSVVLLFAAVLTKHEIGMAVGLVHALSWWAHGIPRKTVAAIVGFGAVVGLLFLAAFAADDPGDHALLAENFLRYSKFTEGLFFHRLGGLDQPTENMILTLKSSGQVAALILLASIAGAALPMIRQKKWIPVLAGIVAALACAWLVLRIADVRLFQAALPLALALTLYYAVRNRRDPLFLLSAFVALSALRIPLKFYPVWFGFYLVPPAFPFVIHALGVRATARLPGRRFVVFALGALAIVMLFRFQMSSSRSYRAMTSALVTPKGVLKDFPVGRAEAVADFLAYVEERFPEKKPTMVVFPEGVSLNYFTGMKNPTAYYLFIPPQISSPTVEERLLDELRAGQPEYIALTSRNTSEFGRKGFGVDYGLRVTAWINRAYSPERVFRGPEGTSWRLVLLRRRTGQ